MAEGLPRKDPKDQGFGLQRPKDKDGNIPLHVAARASNSDVIRTLLSLDRSGLEERNLRGQTALFLAVQSGNAEGVECLLEEGANPNIVAYDGSTIWHAAASSGKIEMITLLTKALNPEKNVIKELKKTERELSPDSESKKKFKSSPSKEDKKAAGSSKDINIHVKDDSPNQECIDSNIHSQAGISSEDKETSRNIRIHAIEQYIDSCSREEDALKKFNDFLAQWRDGGKEVPLFHTLSQLDEAYMESELEKIRQQLTSWVWEPSDVYLVDDDGFTLLHRAAITGEEGFAKAMLKRDNVDVNAKAFHGQTPFMLACLSDSDGMIDLLMEAGADYKHEDHLGSTALHFAANRKSLVAVQKLLNLGLDPNKKNKIGETPLHTAAMMGGNFAVIIELMQHGADRFVQNDEGYTPVSYFLKYNKFLMDSTEEVVKEMFEGY